MVQIVDNTPSDMTLRMRALTDPAAQMANAINTLGSAYLQSQATKRQQAIDYATAINQQQAQDPLMTEADAANKAGLGDYYQNKLSKQQVQSQPNLIDQATGAISKLFQPSQDQQDQKIVQGLDYSALGGQPASKIADNGVGQADAQPQSVAQAPQDQQAQVSDSSAPQGPVSRIIQTSLGPKDISQYPESQQRQILAQQASIAQAQQDRLMKNNLDSSTIQKNNADAQSLIANSGKTQQETIQAIKDSNLTSSEKLAKIAEVNSIAGKNNAETVNLQMLNPLVQKQNEAFAKYEESVKAIRSEPAYQKAQYRVGQGQALIDKLAALNGSASPQDIHGLAAESAGVAEGGPPSISGTEGAMPTGSDWTINGVKNKFASQPINYTSPQYFQNMEKSAKDFKTSGQQYVNDKEGEVLFHHADLIGPGNLAKIAKEKPAVYANYLARMNGTYKGYGYQPDGEQVSVGQNQSQGGQNANAQTTQGAPWLKYGGK